MACIHIWAPFTQDLSEIHGRGIEWIMIFLGNVSWSPTFHIVV